MIVSNASPLINFGKQSKSDILKKCFGKIIIPRRVYDEIAIKEDAIETIVLKKAIEEKWIFVEDIKINKFLKTQNIGEGEKEAISLAAAKKSILLIDDDIVKEYASLLGVEAHGSFYVLYLACELKVINKDEAKEILDRMVKEGFYVSTELYSRFFDLLGSF